MEKFVNHSGKAVAIDLANIDTDQIIPKQFLKRIERSGYGEFLFYDWRFSPTGELIDDFVLNRPEAEGVSILIAGDNFGCGSSREHAPWSLLDYGFRVIVAPSFADIFYNNSLKTGLLPLVLDSDDCASLATNATASPDHQISVDLEACKISDNAGFSSRFEIDEFRKYCLLNGLDDIGLSLQHESAISGYELSLQQNQPFLAFSS
ncbi:MAG TPA: 3-isopropylmalate dehydratase small subunit [Pyrinomonadaceae bacterium]|nr:3-isopropylmalate dehydratase small subunit [Pyrinomonadaceae bacterium]